jgi:RimJ/RimL family protein N-acetyltransferase
MTPIRTKRLILRNWEERDRPLFHRINSDDRVMEFFPVRRDRKQSDALFDQLRDFVVANGFGFSAIEIAATGECAGFAGLYRADYLEPFLPAGTIEIGWRLAPEYWGHGYVTEASRAHLAYGFETLGFDEIVSFAVSGNRRSTAVMERLGMLRDGAGDFDHPRVPDSHPQLKHHVLYRLPRQVWLSMERAAS